MTTDAKLAEALKTIKAGDIVVRVGLFNEDAPRESVVTHVTDDYFTATAEYPSGESFSRETGRARHSLQRVIAVKAVTQ